MRYVKQSIAVLALLIATANAGAVEVFLGGTGVTNTVLLDPPGLSRLSLSEIRDGGAPSRVPSG